MPSLRRLLFALAKLRASALVASLVVLLPALASALRTTPAHAAGSGNLGAWIMATQVGPFSLEEPMTFLVEGADGSTDCRQVDDACHGPRTQCSSASWSVPVTLVDATCGADCSVEESRAPKTGSVLLSVRARTEGDHRVQVRVRTKDGQVLTAQTKARFEAPQQIALSRNALHSPHGNVYALVPGVGSTWCAEIRGGTGAVTFGAEKLLITVSGAGAITQTEVRRGHTKPDGQCTTFVAAEPGIIQVQYTYFGLRRSETLRVLAPESAVRIEPLTVTPDAIDWGGGGRETPLAEDPLRAASVATSLTATCDPVGPDTVRVLLAARFVTADGEVGLAPAQAFSVQPAALASFAPRGSFFAELRGRAQGSGSLSVTLGSLQVDVPLRSNGACANILPDAGAPDADQESP